MKHLWIDVVWVRITAQLLEPGGFAFDAAEQRRLRTFGPRADRAFRPSQKGNTKLSDSRIPERQRAIFLMESRISLLQQGAPYTQDGVYQKLRVE
jgi:hypothetical protein